MPGYNDFHSQEAQQIMGKAPSWVIRWGVTVIFVILAGILLGCWFIKYPETIEAPIIITTVNPPSELAARTDGLITRIYVTDGENVGKGDVIAVIENPADYESLVRFEERLDIFENKPISELVFDRWLDSLYNLGDLQSAYSELKSLCQNYRNYLETGYIDEKIKLLNSQIKKNREYFSKLLQQQKLLLEDMAYVNKSLARDSLLFSRGVISSSEYENAYRTKLDKQNTIAAFNATLVGTELTIIQTEQQVIELEIQRENEKMDHELKIDQIRQQLTARIEQWKMDFTITSPVSGTVTFTNYWSGNQRIRSGEILATVIPDGELLITGRAFIPSSGFGKVAVGQTVNIKLNGFPYMEYGILKGEIRTISAVPDAEKGYVADVRFPAELTTSYGRQIAMIQQMDGVSEIITKDERLIQRFLQPIRAIFDK